MGDHGLNSSAAISCGSGVDTAFQRGDDGTSGAFSWLLPGTDISQGVHRHGFEGLFKCIHSLDMYSEPTVCQVPLL